MSICVERPPSHLFHGKCLVLPGVSEKSAIKKIANNKSGLKTPACHEPLSHGSDSYHYCSSINYQPVKNDQNGFPYKCLPIDFLCSIFDMLKNPSFPKRKLPIFSFDDFVFLVP